MKNYLIKVLYDNGVEETYKTGEVSEEQLDDVVNVVAQSFNHGTNAYLQLPNDDGLNTIIDLSKVSKVDFLNQD